MLPRTKLQAHTRHFFDHEVLDAGTVSHLRFNIFPDGGVSRLRVFGKNRRSCKRRRESIWTWLKRLNSLPAKEAEAEFGNAVARRNWADAWLPSVLS